MVKPGVLTPVRSKEVIVGILKGLMEMERPDGLSLNFNIAFGWC